MSNEGASRRPVVVGLVGGIASGKSAVARMFAEAGAAVVDADREAHAMLAEPEVAEAVRREWGDEMFGPDGGVDRAALAERVFDDAEALARLEGLIHPRVAEVVRRRIEAAARTGDARVVVIDAPLLVESGLDDLCDRIVFVEAEEDTRKKRARSVRGWDPSELERRERRQIPLSAKRRKADTVIDNRGSLDETRSEVTRLYDRLPNPASSPEDSHGR